MTNGMTGALPPARLVLPGGSSAGARRNWTLTNLPSSSRGAPVTVAERHAPRLLLGVRQTGHQPQLKCAAMANDTGAGISHCRDGGCWVLPNGGRHTMRIPRFSADAALYEVSTRYSDRDLFQYDKFGILSPLPVFGVSERW